MYKKKRKLSTNSDGSEGTSKRSNKADMKKDKPGSKNTSLKATTTKQATSLTAKPQAAISEPSTTCSSGPSTVWKGKGVGKTSAKAEAAKQKNQNETSADQDTSQGCLSANDNLDHSPMEDDYKKPTIGQVDGINDDNSSESSESLASTVLMSEASVSLLENREPSQQSCDGHYHDCDSQGSSRGQAACYDRAAVEREIFQTVSLAPGWPTMAEALGSIPHEETEPLMRPDFGNPDMRVSDGSMATTSEFSESSIDGEEEVNCLNVKC